jgi:hypothetical protein
MRKLQRRLSRFVLPLLAIVAILTYLVGAHFAAPGTKADDGDLGYVDTHQDFLSGTVPDPTTVVPGPSSSPTSTGQPPRVGPNVQANAPQLGFPNGLFGRSETSVASTDDGQNIVVGFNDAQGFCGAPFGVACTPESPPGLSGYAFSTDGGLTWTDGGAPPAFNNVFTRGDPWMDRGGLDNATFYYANLAVDATTGASLGASIHRGHFNGSSFSWSDVQTVAPPNPNDSYDKEAFVAAKDGSGAAYLTITNFIALPCPAFPNTLGAFGQIEVWRTHDGGNTWQGPVIVSPDMTSKNPSDPNCGNTGTLQQSSVPAIGPNGELDMVWTLGPTFTTPNGTFGSGAAVAFARSTDGGITFSTPQVIATTNTMRANVPVGYNRPRFNDHPRIAVATSGPHKGRIYVTYYSATSPVAPVGVVPCPSGVSGTCIGQNLVSSQAYLIFSDDGGQTWSAPVQLASSVPATGVKRFWPVVNVEPGGNVDVVYLESQETTTASNPVCSIRLSARVHRVGSANSLVNTFWVQSTDGGATFGAPLEVSSATSNWCTAVSNVTPNFGDYIGATAAGNRTLATWGDGRNGVPDTFYATILGAGKSG